MAHTNLKTQKKRPYNPFRAVIIKMAKVDKVKCFCKAIKPNPKDVFGEEKADGLYYNSNGHNCIASYYGAERFSHDTVYYYEVGASDGSYRKCTTEEESLMRFEQLIEFEKRQTKIE